MENTEIVDSLSESWVDLGSGHGSGHGSRHGSGHLTPVVALSTFVTEEYIRILKEAQRETSSQSSARVSIASSRLESPRSPPNSPNNELANGDELVGIFINKESEGAKEWFLNYLTARCDAKTKLTQRKPNLSLRNAKFAGRSIFSREVIYIFLISNVFSVIVGAGIGMLLRPRLFQNL